MTNHPNRSQGDYLVTEPYDGSHVRIIAAGRTPAAANEQFEREKLARRRQSADYTFFSPVRRVRGRRRAVEGMLDREVAALPTWDEPDTQ